MVALIGLLLQEASRQKLAKSSPALPSNGGLFLVSYLGFLPKTNPLIIPLDTILKYMYYSFNYLTCKGIFPVVNIVLV